MLISIVLMALGQAPVEPTDGADVMQWVMSTIQWTVEQFHAKNYLPAVAAIVMVLTFAVKKILGDKLKTEQLALVSAGLGLLTSLATELAGMAMGSGTFDILRAVAGGLLVGPLASGFWSLLGKKIFTKKTQPAADASQAK